MGLSSTVSMKYMYPLLVTHDLEILDMISCIINTNHSPIMQGFHGIKPFIPCDLERSWYRRWNAIGHFLAPVSRDPLSYVTIFTWHKGWSHKTGTCSLSVTFLPSWLESPSCSCSAIACVSLWKTPCWHIKVTFTLPGVQCGDDLKWSKEMYYCLLPRLLRMFCRLTSHMLPTSICHFVKLPYHLILDSFAYLSRSWCKGLV